MKLSLSIFPTALLLTLSFLLLPDVGAAEKQPPLLWGFALDGYPITHERLDAVERETGLIPGMVVFFLQWPSPANLAGASFPLDSVIAVWERGAVPCITWEPMYHEKGREIMISVTLITEGEYDAYIETFARQAAAWGKPLMIRFAHEMNIVRYHWGTEKSAYGPQSPEIYRRMYQHVVSVFKRRGTPNVLWVFCANAESVPDRSYDVTASWNRIGNYYPGEEFVDILGIDGYNWGATQTRAQHGWDSRWQSFPEIFEPAYKELRALAPAKPLIVFETASVSEGGDKGEWVRQALKTAQNWEMDGIAWFQAQKEQDWRIESGLKDRRYGYAIRRAASYPQSRLRSLLQ